MKKSNLKTLEQVIEAMPIYGELREENEQLTFGQYFTVLKRWFERLRTEAKDFKRDIPFRLDILAQQIYTAFKDGCPNYVKARELAERWSEKEISGK